MRLSLLVRSPSSASFFTPSYLSRPPLALALAHARGISCSAHSANSNSHGSGPNRLKPFQQPAVAGPRRSSPAPAPAPAARGVGVGGQAAKPATPLAPSLPHASRNLIMSDSFFALHRPLLELPIRLSARKSVAPAPRLWEPLEDPNELDDERRAAEVEREDIEACGRAVDRATGLPPPPRATAADADADAELVQVIELGPDGFTHVGEPYLAKVGASELEVGLEVKDEASETELDDEALDRQATEAAMDDIENGLPNPYEPWLIGTHEADLPSTAAVSRYLATHAPFVAPAPPAARATSPVRPKAASAWTPQVQSDLSFLRPFSTSSLAPTPTDAANANTNAAFASHFLDPLPSGLASQVADQFLSAAILSHRFTAYNDYATNSGEALELARRAYSDQLGPLAPRRRAFDEPRQRGEVRLWNEEEGWVTVDLGSKGRAQGSSPFLPAEMVDLDWEDGELERLASLDGVRMDSVKRKRKKKITKHKYKKRRKAQQALRQRLGK